MNLPNQKTNLHKIQNYQKLLEDIPNEYINTDYYFGFLFHRFQYLFILFFF